MSQIGQAIAMKSTSTLSITILFLSFMPLLYMNLKNKNKIYVVTNQRLYVEEGILSKKKTDVPFHKINDISFDQTFMQRLFGSGTVSVMTGNDKPTELTDLDGAESFRDSLSNACHKKVA